MAKKSHITVKDAISVTLKTGRLLRDNGVTIYTKNFNQPLSFKTRIFPVVSKRTAKKAVDRNKLKRIIRASLVKKVERNAVCVVLVKSFNNINQIKNALQGVERGLVK